jgi:hypothetical protein
MIHRSIIDLAHTIFLGLKQHRQDHVLPMPLGIFRTRHVHFYRLIDDWGDNYPALGIPVSSYLRVSSFEDYRHQKPSIISEEIAPEHA